MVLGAVLILDFVLPGKPITEEVVAIKKDRQQYYNAAQNSHYSYRIITETRAFPISENFAGEIAKGEQIIYSISYLFAEVNTYGKAAGKSQIYSLRWFTGLVIPLFAMLVFFLRYRSKTKYGTLAFVMQMLVIGDLIFVIFW